MSSCAYQGVRNVGFSENFAYVRNEWSQAETEKLRDGCKDVLKSDFKWMTKKNKKDKKDKKAVTSGKVLEIIYSLKTTKDH